MRRVATPSTVLERPCVLPGLTLAVREAPVPYLVAEFDNGELLVDPGRLLLRTGTVLLTGVEGSGLARAWGIGRLVVGGGLSGGRVGGQGRRTVLVVRVEAGASVLFAPEALMAATPGAALLPALGQHGEEALLLRAPAGQAVWLVVAGGGTAVWRALATGEAMDCARGGLLLADSTVDLAAGEYGSVPQHRRFVQCLGPGMVVVQRGNGEG